MRTSSILVSLVCALPLDPSPRDKIVQCNYVSTVWNPNIVWACLEIKWKITYETKYFCKRVMTLAFAFILLLTVGSTLNRVPQQFQLQTKHAFYRLRMMLWDTSHLCLNNLAELWSVIKDVHPSSSQSQPLKLILNNNRRTWLL